LKTPEKPIIMNDIIYYKDQDTITCTQKSVWVDIFSSLGRLHFSGFVLFSGPLGWPGCFGEVLVGKISVKLWSGLELVVLCLLFFA